MSVLYIYALILFSPAGSAVPVRMREKAAGVGGGNRGSAPDVMREQQQLVQQKEKERSSDPVREPAPTREKQPGELTELLFYDTHVHQTDSVCVSVCVWA